MLSADEHDPISNVLSSDAAVKTLSEKETVVKGETRE